MTTPTGSPTVGDSFGERLDEEAREWVREGIIEPEQAERILDRYEAKPSEDGAGLGSLLYGAASVLFGAAVIALVLVGFDPTDPEPALAGLGLVVSAAGAVLPFVRPEQELIGDTLMAAGLAPVTAAVVEAPTSGGAEASFVVAGLVLPAALIVWRRARPFVPALSVIAFSVASGFAFLEIFEDAAAEATIWLVAQALLVAGLVAIDRWWTGQDAPGPVTLAVGGLGASLAYFLSEALELGSEEAVQLALGGVMVVVISLGLALKHRGLALGGAIVLGIDAFVFAFTVAGPWLGAGLLAGLAVLLIWQAEALKDWLAEPA